MTALLLLLVSAKVSGWDVQKMERVKLGSSPGKSSQWGCRKSLLPWLRTRVFIHVSLISGSGAGRIRRDGQQPKCYPGSGSGVCVSENLLVAQARACEIRLALMMGLDTATELTNPGVFTLVSRWIVCSLGFAVRMTISLDQYVIYLFKKIVLHLSPHLY